MRHIDWTAVITIAVILGSAYFVARMFYIMLRAIL